MVIVVHRGRQCLPRTADTDFLYCADAFTRSLRRMRKFFVDNGKASKP